MGELGPAWLDRQRGHLKPSGYAVMETTWRLRVKPRWGNVALGDIRPTAVQLWISDLGRGTADVKPVGASVVKRTHHVLSRILADAVRDNLIARNPAVGVKLPRPTRKRPVYLTHEHVAALAAASGEYEGLVLTLSYCGLRWGEVVGLRVRDLDMLRRRATISENAVQSGNQINVGTPKAHKQRTVPLPEFLLTYLARQCEGEDATICCSLATTAGTFAARIRCRGGSPRLWPNPGFRARRHTICGTPRPASRCRPARTSRRCRRCSATPRRR